MTVLPVSGDRSLIRLLGRIDESRSPLAFDWTASGLEVRYKGSDLWAELEAPVSSPVMWMIVLCDGKPVTRFPVEEGKRFYPLILGMDAEHTRTVTLLKETQCMPAAPEATVLFHALKMDGSLQPLPEKKLTVEFVGDSLTSGEGSLAPIGNDEWITIWFSARANYAWIACDALNAEPRILSQSGFGVCWDWQHLEENNLYDGYEQIAGVLKGASAEVRGCGKAYDFSAKKADIVCIRLTTNDVNGMNQKNSLESDTPILTERVKDMIRKVRRCNPTAKIVWILPGTDSHPEIAANAVEACRQEGVKELYTFTLPDYTEAEMGARSHPNAVWNRKAGLLLADYLKTLL